MYADKLTDSMRKAIDETERRRNLQIDYNLKHGLDPKPLQKKISDISAMLAEEEIENEELGQKKPRIYRKVTEEIVSFDDMLDLVKDLTAQMRVAAERLEFEIAGSLRDEIQEIKREMRQLQGAGMENSSTLHQKRRS
jgi:excinuclease ABC subunit B